LNFRELYRHFFTNSSILVLSWDVPQISNNILDDYHMSATSLGLNLTTSEMFVSLVIPDSTLNTSILLSSCNCVGCGNPSYLTLTSTGNIIQIARPGKPIFTGQAPEVGAANEVLIII